MTDTNALPSVIEFSEDIADAEQPEPLPKSDYLAEIRGVEVKTSNSKGTKYAAVSFYISPEQYPADFDVNNAPDGKTLVYRRVSLEDTAQARFNLRRFLEAIGAPMSKTIDVNEWVGLSGRVTIDHEEYEGVMREQIVKVAAE